MSKKDIDILSEYYQYELSYLRTAGSDFAARFPKIARRLDISSHESSDPQIERMIESFAFLTGKLQKQIDDQFPEIARTLLDVIYPPLLRPIPSCVMVNFDLDISRASKTAGTVIPRNTRLQTISYSGETCSFRTAHDMELWPVDFVNVQLIPREEIPGYFARAIYYIKMDFRYMSASSQPSKLRFYINANALAKSKIYAALFSCEEQVIFQKENELLFTGNKIYIQTTYHIVAHLFRSLTKRIPKPFGACSKLISNMLRKASEQSPATTPSEAVFGGLSRK